MIKVQNIPEWMKRDLKRWIQQKGCAEQCNAKNDLSFCLKCMMGQITPEERDKQIDRILEEVQKGIDTYGWFTMVVMDEQRQDNFAYSIGLWETFRHPEILILGCNLSFETLKGTINNIGMFIKETGRVFYDGEVDEDTIMTMPVKFVRVNKKYYKTYFKMLYNLHDTFDYEFEALQMLWTDRAGIFPDEEEYSEEFKNQLVLK